MKPLVLLGATNSVAVSVIDALNRVRPTWRLLGFVDDAPPPLDVSLLGHPYLGTTERLADLLSPGDVTVFNNVNRTPELSREADRMLDGLDCRRTSLVHPSVDLTHATHGPNCLLPQGTIVGPGARLGRHVTCRFGVTISHDVQVGDYVYLSPHSVACGRSRLEDDVELGAGARVLPEIRIGRGTFVGAGSVVSRDLPPGVRAVGFSARVVRDTRQEDAAPGP